MGTKSRLYGCYTGIKMKQYIFFCLGFCDLKLSLFNHINAHLKVNLMLRNVHSKMLKKKYPIAC